MNESDIGKTTGFMTRRSFVKVGAMASGAFVLSGLTACGSQSPSSSSSSSASSFSTTSDPVTASANASSSAVSSNAPQVYFTKALDSGGMQAVFAAIGQGLGSGRIGVKLSSGEPGGNHYLKANLIAGLVHAVGGTIVECNTAYGGGRSTTERHYQVAADHGFIDIADFQIMDEDGSIPLPIEGGFRLSEDLVGSRFADYDGFLVLSHFKGHAMAGFGGALKNISIGMASREGKGLIHSGGTSTTNIWGGEQSAFLESMADACKAVLTAQPNMLFINVMNNLSVDCDCDSNPAPPKMADIGILASADPVALDQACVDLVYASDDDSADLIARMESRNGVRVLEAAESLGVGSRAYELVEIG